MLARKAKGRKLMAGWRTQRHQSGEEKKGQIIVPQKKFRTVPSDTAFNNDYESMMVSLFWL